FKKNLYFGPTSEFPSYGENGNDTSLLVSPLLVAGVVIGLVLFLSCVTIIVGSLRKDGRLRHPHQRRDTVYAPDGFSYGGSFGELRSTCMEEFPPAFDFGSYLDTLSQVNIMYPDSPPRYDECVGPGATQMYIPTDDPPPYSLTDPCQGNEISINISLEEEEASGTTGQAANYAVRLQDLQQPISSISLSSLTLEAAPLYETVVCEQNIPIPLFPKAWPVPKPAVNGQAMERWQWILTHRLALPIRLCSSCVQPGSWAPFTGT
uniref:Protein BEAN1 n=1 Tax=Anser cygnoides TaxID=8845 RepID=A0A8B9DA64_ANSCY